VIDERTGEVRQAQLFVAALGALSLTYAEASWSQSLSDWIGAHCRAFACFGGVPAQVVCYNLKSGVTKACFYEPAVNRTYAGTAAHYGTAVVPARPYKPRDKAKVEVAVQIAERWIVVSQTRLRHDAPAQSEVLLVGGIERRNPRPPRPAERPRHPASWRQPPGPVRSGRAIRPAALAGRALRLL